MKNNKNKHLLSVVTSAIIAALYVALTYLLPFSFGSIQLRLSESLFCFVIFSSASPWGLFFGCLISNILMGNIFDIVIGTLATGLAALLGRMISLKFKREGIIRFLLSVLPEVILNTIAIPFVIYFGYGISLGGDERPMVAILAAQALSIFLSELIAVVIIGYPLYKLIDKYNIFKFIKE